jgi:hypothetical protein
MDMVKARPLIPMILRKAAQTTEGLNSPLPKSDVSINIKDKWRYSYEYL